MRTPSPLPAPALWDEPRRWGWAKGRALRLGPRGFASSAALLRTRGLRCSRVFVRFSGRWAGTQKSEKKRHLPKGLELTGPETLFFHVAAETATAGGGRPPGAPGSSGPGGERTRSRRALPAGVQPAAEARGGAAEGGDWCRRRAGWERC